jgi:serine protease Do
LIIIQKRKKDSQRNLFNVRYYIMLKLPKIKFKRKEKVAKRNSKAKYFSLVAFSTVILSLVSGLIGGYIYIHFINKDGVRTDNSGFNIFNPVEKVIETEVIREYVPQTSSEQKVIEVVEELSPSVVSINIFKPRSAVRIIVDGVEAEPEKDKVSEGTGFVVSEDGIIVTNKHVVSEEGIEIRISTSDGEEYLASILDIDPLLDLALLRISDASWAGNVKPLTLGDSANIQSGQTVIAIGNALGEFQNTVSVGVVSGLNRTLVAASNGFAEIIEDLIQTDAAINLGNSGGPLINLEGEVIGINTAMSSGQNLGFAIPINQAKKAIDQVKETGEISYPFLGVRYVMITDEIQEDNDLPIGYGALLVNGENGEQAVIAGSGAGKAGLTNGDIIIELNGVKIDLDNPLAKEINKYNAGDQIEVTIMRKGSIIRASMFLGKREE